MCEGEVCPDLGVHLVLVAAEVDHLVDVAGGVEVPHERPGGIDLAGPAVVQPRWMSTT